MPRRRTNQPGRPYRSEPAVPARLPEWPHAVRRHPVLSVYLQPNYMFRNRSSGARSAATTAPGRSFCPSATPFRRHFGCERCRKQGRNGTSGSPERGQRPCQTPPLAGRKVGFGNAVWHREPCRKALRRTTPWLSERYKNHRKTAFFRANRSAMAQTAVFRQPFVRLFHRYFMNCPVRPPRADLVSGRHERAADTGRRALHGYAASPQTAATCSRPSPVFYCTRNLILRPHLRTFPLIYCIFAWLIHYPIHGSREI